MEMGERRIHTSTLEIFEIESHGFLCWSGYLLLYLRCAKRILRLLPSPPKTGP